MRNIQHLRSAAMAEHSDGNRLPMFVPVDLAIKIRTAVQQALDERGLAERSVALREAVNILSPAEPGGRKFMPRYRELILFCEHAERDYKKKNQERGGRCCSCGYEGEKETSCKPRTDKTHCVHWWDGPTAAAEARAKGE